jgi:transcription elongation factor Elf1
LNTRANGISHNSTYLQTFGFYIRKTPHSLAYRMKCACCGTEMLPDKELEKTIIYKCKECGLSDSRLKDTE